MFHDKLKNIEIKYHYIRDMVQRWAMKLQYVVMDEQITNVLTKPLAKVKFEYFKEKLGVLQIEVSSKEKWWAQKTQIHMILFDMVAG